MPSTDSRKAAKARALASLALISDAEEAAINRGIDGDPEAMEMTIDVLKQANPEPTAASHDAFALPLL
ncbi:MAG: hypothetical protein ACOVVK_23925 [Elsteraceae bacterium]